MIAHAAFGLAAVHIRPPTLVHISCASLYLKVPHPPSEVIPHDVAHCDFCA